MNIEQTQLHQDPKRLAAFQRGQKDVLEEIYVFYMPILTRFVAHGVSSKQGGQVVEMSGTNPLDRFDIVQETFVRAFTDKARHSYSGKVPYGAYLLRICRNLAVDQFRAETTRRRFMIEDQNLNTDEGPSIIAAAQAQETPTQTHSPEKMTLRREILETLTQFVASLDAKERELLRLYYKDDRSQRQAAAQMDLTRNQIRTLVANLRNKILLHMKDAGFIQNLEPGELLSLVGLALALHGG